MKTKPGFNIRNVCGQNLIVAEGEENIDFCNIISMNDTSTYLWNNVQKMDGFTVDDMVRLLTEEYDIDEASARKDCIELAARWGEAGILSGDDIPVLEKSSEDVVKNTTEPVADNEAPSVMNEDKPKKRGFFSRLFHISSVRALLC